MAEVAWKRSRVGVPCVVCREAFPALISPPSRYCNRGFRSAAFITGAEIAKKDTFPGTPAVQAEFTRGGEELSSQVPVLGQCICPKMKAFCKVGCIEATFAGGVSGGRGESQLVGAAGRGQGELCGALVPWRSRGMLPSLSSGTLKS